jgi:hypothetical protein
LAGWQIAGIVADMRTLNKRAAGLVTSVKLIDGVTKFALAGSKPGQQWRSGRWDRPPSQAGRRANPSSHRSGKRW